MQTLNNTFDKKSQIKSLIKNIKQDYKPYTPAQFLYKQILKWKLSPNNLEKFIELVYATLCAWNMNQRQAKLSSFADFRDSIAVKFSFFRKLANYKLEDLTPDDFDNLQSDIKELFLEIEFVSEGKPILVTASKCLHYFLPNLIMPIDRSYTLTYYNGHMSIPGTKENQFRLFWKIQKDAHQFSISNDLSIYKDEEMNRNIPKIIDNIIIKWKSTST